MKNATFYSGINLTNGAGSVIPAAHGTAAERSNSSR
jgi:hypothetical protein